jgi:hypothetical protein
MLNHVEAQQELEVAEENHYCVLSLAVSSEEPELRIALQLTLCDKDRESALELNADKLAAQFPGVDRTDASAISLPKFVKDGTLRAIKERKRMD